MTSTEALDYAIERLRYEASVRPERQQTDVLQRKLDAIAALTWLRNMVAP